MKKYILAALVVLGTTISTQAQNKVINMTGSDATTDTITNAGTTYLTSPILTAYRGGFTITLKTTNVSGTSTFKAILQGSNNGSEWTNVYQVPGTDGVNCDTLQVTSAAPAYWGWRVVSGSVKSATSSTFWHTNATRYAYYRIACVGTGTQSTIVAAQILPH